MGLKCVTENIVADKDKLDDNVENAGENRITEKCGFSTIDNEDEEEHIEKNSTGDAEHELTKEEGTPISAQSWKLTFMNAEFAEDINIAIANIKPFERCGKTSRVIATKSLCNVIEGFCLFLDCGTKIPVKIMKTLTLEVFGCCDLLFEVCKKLPDKMMKLSYNVQYTWWNIYHFMKFLPSPTRRVIPRIFHVENHPLKWHKKSKLVNSFENLWITLMKCNISPKVLLSAIPFISDNILDTLREPHKTADFFFRVYCNVPAVLEFFDAGNLFLTLPLLQAFGKGDVYAILSLGAIFKLIVSYNFEYPNFYDHVYSLTKSAVLYMDHKEKFIGLLDTFLSSTHIPIYIVAGFVKRLSRMLLLAPLDAQEPVLGLIRNLLTRHPNIISLMHREVPEAVPSDPYDDVETSLSKCNAISSSLWEIKSLQRHWNLNVVKRANFIDKGLQKMESFVRYRCQDELFSNLMSKRFGKDQDDINEEYIKRQDGSEDDEIPSKRARMASKGKGGKFTKKHEAKNRHAISTNFQVPSGKLFPDNSFNLEYKQFWTV